MPLDPGQKGLLEKERWTGIFESAKAGRLDEIGEEYPKQYIAHYSTFKRIKKDYAVRPEALESEFRRPDGTRNVWIWGPTGVGKTWKAKDLCETYYKKNLNKWWDHYRGEEGVILDEVGPNQDWMSEYLKIWGQEDPFVAESKGSSSWIRPKKIIVTSNYSINDIWGDENVRAAMKGRFYVLHMTERAYENVIDMVD